MTSLQGIRTKYEALVQTDRNSARMAAVIDFVFSRPILTIKQLESGLDMPYMGKTLCGKIGGGGCFTGDYRIRAQSRLPDG